VSWEILGAAAPRELVDARLQLHHAAQVVASAGLTLLEPRPDDSHPNLGWVEGLGALLGHAWPEAGTRAGLRVRDLTLLLVDESGKETAALALDGRTLDQGYAWLASAASRAGAGLPSVGWTRSSYQIPDHPIGRGAAFSHAPREAFDELARWLANGHHALVAQAVRTPGASDVRCWPHHFDLGALAILATDAEGNPTRTIGTGLSPGDGSYPEPYWYVSPWPYPAADALPAVRAGSHWHTEGFTAAVLTGSDLVGGAPEGQAERVRAFLGDAVEASRRALGESAD